MSDFKLLFDTNIFIGLEDAGQIDPRFAELVQRCGLHGVKIFIHSEARRDIARDRNLIRRDISFSRIRKFSVLSGIPLPTRLALEADFGRITKPQDEVDVALLYALKINAVHFVVTQDHGIHARVRDTNLNKRVLSVDDALVWLRQSFEPTKIRLPLVQECKAHELDPADDIFESLREGYAGFDTWWKEKCVVQHRDCWTVTIDSELAGLIVRKDETPRDALTTLVGFRILKICTFKVKPQFRGEKIGELLLKQVLWFAQRNDYDLVYLTTFPTQAVLIDVLEYFGFVHTADAPSGELVYEKQLTRQRLIPGGTDDLFRLCRLNYPRFVARQPANVFCVPIQNAYHQKLFPELAIPTPMPLFPDDKNFIVPTGDNRIPGNTIRKVYLCRARTTNIRPGDCLLFYRSMSPGFASSQSITSVAVTEAVSSSGNFDEIVHITAKRSVFSEEELRLMVRRSDAPLKIIDFLLVGHVDPPVPLGELLSLNVLTAPPQSISIIPPDRFEPLRKKFDFSFEL